jgi:hypothetical protein
MWTAIFTDKIFVSDLSGHITFTLPHDYFNISKNLQLFLSTKYY